MREIKFRAWDTEQKCWYEPVFKGYENKIYEILLCMSGEIVMRTSSELKHQSLFPNKFILSQYTGLKDRNGKEIYEGDVVKREWVEIRPGYEDFIGVVKYVEGSFCIEDIEDPFSGDTLFIEIGTNEVIGNIYETKEE